MRQYTGILQVWRPDTSVKRLLQKKGQEETPVTPPLNATARHLQWQQEASGSVPPTATAATGSSPSASHSSPLPTCHACSCSSGPGLVGLIRRRTCSVRRPLNFSSSSWMNASVSLWQDSKMPCSFSALSPSVAISRRSSRLTSSGISDSCGVRWQRARPAQFSSDGGAMGRGERVARVRRALLLLLALGLGVAGSLPESCLLPRVVGRCRASFPRWWYNATSQVCQQFTFGGCRGNPNNFITEEDCLQKCATGGEEATDVPLPSQGGEGLPATKGTSKSGHHHSELGGGFAEFCAVPQETGPCRASFPRWYFDMETQTCKKFIYGGCRGNKNNYDLEETCLKWCSGKTPRGDAGDPEEPNMHSHLFPGPTVHSTRAVILAVLLAIMAAVLVGSTVAFLVKICRKNQDLSLGSVWSTLDDKEYLMSNAYTL